MDVRPPLRPSSNALSLVPQKPEDEDYVTVKQSESRFVFTVESTGSMQADEIVKSALKQLREKLFQLNKEITELDAT